MQYINKQRLLALFLVLTLLFTILLSYAQKTGNDISNSVMRLLKTENWFGFTLSPTATLKQTRA